MVSRVPAAQDKHTTPGGRLGRRKKKIKRKKRGHTHKKDSGQATRIKKEGCVNEQTNPSPTPKQEDEENDGSM